MTGAMISAVLAAALLATGAPADPATRPAGRLPVLAGRIVNAATGEPIPGARVDVYSWRDPETSRERRAAGDPLGDPVASGVAGADGGYRIEVPAATRVMVASDAPGFARSSYRRPLMTPSGTAARDIGRLPLQAGRRLDGKVVDPAGAPVGGATVIALPDDASRGRRGAGASTFARALARSRAAPGFPVVATTAPDGTFSLDGLARRPATLRVYAEGMAPGRLTDAGTGARATIRLEKGHAIPGKVLSPDGKKPVPDAWVLAGEDGIDGIARTGPDGAFRFDRLPSGSVTIAAVLARDAGADGGGQPTEASTWAPSLPVAIRLPAPADAPPPALKLRPGGIVRVRAIDEAAREPVAGAWISISPPGEPDSRAAVADADGRVAFIGVPVGGIEASVESDGYLDQTIAPRPVSAGQTVEMAAALRAAASIEGTVRDAAGRPVSGAEVSVLGPPPGRLSLPIPMFFSIGIDPVATDVQGRFRFDRLPPGDELKIEVASPGYVPWNTAGIKLRPGEHRDGLEALLDAGMMISGKLADPDGRPVAGAEVAASRRPEGGPAGMVISIGGRGRGRRGGAGPGGGEAVSPVVSDEDGVFRVRGVRPGIWSLEIAARGFAPHTIAGLKLEEEAHDGLDAGDIVLQPGAILRGRVVGPSGEPIPFAGGRVTKELSTLSEFTADVDGVFASGDLVPGEPVTLSLDADGYATAERDGILPPADDLLVTLVPSSRVSGQVVDEETRRPITDFGVSLSRSRSLGGGGMMFTTAMMGPSTPFHSEDGSFTIEDVDPGRISLSADAPGYKESGKLDLTVPEGEDLDGVTIMLSRSASITGMVLDDRGRPLANVEVRKKDTSGGGGFRMRMGDGGSTSTDGDGVFLLDGLEPGPMTLQFSHPDFEPAERDVDITTRSVSGLRVTLSRGASIVGMVLRETDASPVNRAAVSAVAAGSDRFSAGLTATTGPDGSFVLEGVPAGRYAVRAEAPGMTSAVAEDVVVAAGAAPPPIELRMGGGTMVSGTIVGIDSGQLPRFTVRAVGATGGFGTSAPVDASGRFEIKGLSPGTVTLIAGSGLFGGRSMAKSLQIPEGTPAIETTIEFPAGGRVEGTVTRGGQPVTGASVIFMKSGTRTSTTATTDTSGAFVVNDLEDGDYDVSVLQFSTGLSHTTRLAVSGEEHLDIELPLATIRGTVSDSGSGQPLDDAVITVEKQGAAPRAGGRGLVFGRDARTDATGRYAIEGLEDGVYTLTATRQGYGFEKRSVSVIPSVETGEVSFELARVEGFSFRAIDAASGLPLRDLSALVLSGGGADPLSPAGSGLSTVLRARLSADASGLFHLDSLQPGDYRVVLGGQGLATVTLHGVTVPGSPTTVSMPAGAVLEVGVEGLAPGETAKCVLLDGQGRAVHVGTFSSEPAFDVRQDAPAVLQGVEPGSYRLRALLPGSGVVEKPVTVTSGGVSRVDLP